MTRRAKLGDTYIDEANGYIVECVRGHPLFPGQTWVYQHRRVMAEKLNRQLLSSEIVHHKDEDGFNNKRRNLEIQSRAKHAALHKTGKRHSQETRKKMKASGARKCTPEWRAAVSQRVKKQHADSQFGQITWSEKTKRATYAKIGNSLQGKPSGRLGKPCSDESRERYRQAAIKREAAKREGKK